MALAGTRVEKANGQLTLVRSYYFPKDTDWNTHKRKAVKEVLKQALIVE